MGRTGSNDDASRARRAPSSDGVDLAIRRLGRGDGPPALLAHATGFCAAILEPLADELPRHTCWAPDFRGHGATRIPEHLGFSWHGMADDVLATVDALGLERPVAFGHSMGGAAILLAEQRRPGTFAGLYCYEPIVFPVAERTPDSSNWLAEGARRRRPSFPSRDEAETNYRDKPPLNELSPAALHAYVTDGFVEQPDGTVTLACRREHEAEMYEMGARHDTFDHLGEVACPVRVAYGAALSVGPATFAPAVAEHLPHGRLHGFDGLMHFGPLADPSRVGADVAAFFASL